jgi:hypothetical protein
MKIPSPTMLTREGVICICGAIPDWKVTKIIGTGASFTDVQTAATWPQGESDIMGEQGRVCSSRARQVYEILLAEDDIWNDEQRMIP